MILTKNSLHSFIVLLLTTIFLASCSSDDNSISDTTQSQKINLDLSPFKLTLPVEQGFIWENTLTPSTSSNEKVFLDSKNFQISHFVTVSEYGNYWRGFTVSNSQDKSDHKSEFYDGKMYGTMAKSDTSFLVANAQEKPEKIQKGTYIDLDQTYAYIELKQDRPTAAQWIEVANSPYAYYSMVNGDAFAKKFEKGDYFKIVIYGLDQDKKVINSQGVEYYLADFFSDKLQINDQWTKVDLKQLGQIKYLVFYLESSDVGQFGMNTPAYFTLRDLEIEVVNK
ncbi:DUF4465 domain-containing protein [Myroides sp. LJL119]